VERRFATELGYTVLEAIHRAHLEQAKQLLVETDLAMYAVAVESGLRDDKHLRRLFRKHEGGTPTAFRRQHRIT